MIVFRCLAAPAALLWLAGAACSGGSSAALDALHALHGRWQSAGLSLVIDSTRAQGKRDPQKPFQWEAFNIRNVEGRMVVFSIGPQLFIGLLDSNHLTVTMAGRQGAWKLARARD